MGFPILSLIIFLPLAAGLLILALPADLLLVAAGLEALWRRGPRLAAVAGASFVAAALLSLGFFYAVPRYPADDYRPVAARMQALGLPGDVLMYVDDGEGHSTAVISAAQAKDMTIVVLAGRGAAAFGELLAETDVLVAVPMERPARIVELQLLVLHCLCDAVDFQLMGEQDT